MTEARITVSWRLPVALLVATTCAVQVLGQEESQVGDFLKGFGTVPPGKEVAEEAFSMEFSGDEDNLLLDLLLGEFMKLKLDSRKDGSRTADGEVARSAAAEASPPPPPPPVEEPAVTTPPPTTVRPEDMYYTPDLSIAGFISPLSRKDLTTETPLAENEEVGIEERAMPGIGEGEEGEPRADCVPRSMPLPVVYPLPQPVIPYPILDPNLYVAYPAYPPYDPETDPRSYTEGVTYPPPEGGEGSQRSVLDEHRERASIPGDGSYRSGDCLSYFCAHVACSAWACTSEPCTSGMCSRKECRAWECDSWSDSPLTHVTDFEYVSAPARP